MFYSDIHNLQTSNNLIQILNQSLRLNEKLKKKKKHVP